MFCLFQVVEDYVTQGLLPPSLVGGQSFYTGHLPELSIPTDEGARGDSAEEES